MNFILKRKEETNVSYEDIVHLIHKSFEDRLKQGLKFTCSFLTVEEYKKDTAKGTVFVALDKDTQELLGTATVNVKKDIYGVTYGYNEYVAIAPKAQRQGIASQLLKECEKIVKEAGAEYIFSDTAVEAKSSIQYHLKNGFKIIGLHSYPSTNYYSYFFRKQLVPSKKWNSNLYCKYAFLKSYIITKLTLRKDGHKTFLASLFKKKKKKKA